MRVIKVPTSGSADQEEGQRAQRLLLNHPAFMALRSAPRSYVAPDEDILFEHARCGGFPADKISKVATIIDWSTGD